MGAYQQHTIGSTLGDEGRRQDREDNLTREILQGSIAAKQIGEALTLAHYIAPFARGACDWHLKEAVREFDRLAPFIAAIRARTESA